MSLLRVESHPQLVSFGPIQRGEVCSGATFSVGLFTFTPSFKNHFQSDGLEILGGRQSKEVQSL